MFNIKKYLILLCFFAAILQFTTVSASDSDYDGLTRRFAKGVTVNAASDDERKGSDSEDEEEIHLPFTVMPSPTPGFEDKMSISFLGNWDTFEERNPGKTREEGYQYMIAELSSEINKTFREHNRERHFDGFSINYSNLVERLLDDLGRILSTCRITNPKINFHDCRFLTKGLLGYFKP